VRTRDWIREGFDRVFKCKYKQSEESTVFIHEAAESGKMFVLMGGRKRSQGRLTLSGV
jgi:hypothetical protein